MIEKTQRTEVITMALVTSMIRCAVCGSSDVTYDGKIYRCPTCGANSDAPMPAADLAAVNRIAIMGGDSDELARLRKRYTNLDITSWTSENRLEVR